MTFLVTGSAGMAGSQVIKDLALHSNHLVYSTFNQTMPNRGNPVKLDLQNIASIGKVISRINPDAVIHLAAITDVDLCETEQCLAMKVNADATGHLAKEAAKVGSFFIYVSTDYVFDGNDGMKKESDKPNPLGFYGKSKLEGEKQVQETPSLNWCIARTSTPFGIHPTKKSFPLFVAENLKKKQIINVLTDQFTSPTYVPNLSQMLIEIAIRRISGIIHVAGATRISRYDVARLVAKELDLDQGYLSPITMDKMQWKAPRPKDSSLDVSLAVSKLNEKPMQIDEGIARFAEEIKPLISSG